MSNKKIKIIWSDEAKADLKYIYRRIFLRTKSKINSTNVKNDIIQASKNIEFVEQYQIDEVLGTPYRRIIVRNFKLVYLPENDSKIIILEVFNSFRSPTNLRK